MCGILGAYFRDENNKLTKEFFSGMLNKLKFRGPDEKTIYQNKNILLGHTRLSIIDLETGSQPIFNEDNSIACISNGEIYNFVELRSQLEKAGHVFRTKTDIEVVVHLYEDKGEDVFKYLNGMFSIVIYDSRNEVFLVGRDRIGEKPLIYYDTPKMFLCASELKALLKDSSIPREIDNNAVAAYLNLLYIPSPLTIFKNIRKLEPAHFLVITKNETKKHKYWNPKISIDRTITEYDINEEMLEIFSDSVRDKMVSDVPLGAFLSGGIDSSAVVAFMAKNTNRPVKTFSVGFNTQINELPYARQVAERYKTDHTEININSNVCDVLSEVVRYYDEPFADSSSIPTYLISKEARKHVKVILTGDGGDELFAGYDRYLSQRYYSNSRVFSKILEMVNNLSISQLNDGLLDCLYPYQSNKGSMQYWASIVQFFDGTEIKRLNNNNMPYNSFTYSDNNWLNFNSEDPLSVAYSHDLNYYLPDDLLKKVDMASMAHGLECRAPFLDYRFIEFSMKIPPELKVKNNQSKYLLKKALINYLPENILYREKHGFGAPLNSWLREDLKEMVNDIMAPGCGIEKLFFRNEISKIIDNVYCDDTIKKDWRASHKLWLLLMLELWMREYA